MLAIHLCPPQPQPPAQQPLEVLNGQEQHPRYHVVNHCRVHEHERRRLRGEGLRIEQQQGCGCFFLPRPAGEDFTARALATERTFFFPVTLSFPHRGPAVPHSAFRIPRQKTRVRWNDKCGSRSSPARGNHALREREPQLGWPA